MANFPSSRRSTLPPPPPPSEIKHNLTQPEHAPTPFVDGRSLRATGRTVQFTTRVTEELQNDIKVFAAQKKLKLNDFLEKAFEALKEKMEDSR